MNSLYATLDIQNKITDIIDLIAGDRQRKCIGIPYCAYFAIRDIDMIGIVYWGYLIARIASVFRD